jgi:hypothetical protein
MGQRLLIATTKCFRLSTNNNWVDEFAADPVRSSRGQDLGEHKRNLSITFRLDSNIIDELQREADQNQISHQDY